MTEKQLFDWVEGAANFFKKEELPKDTSIMLISDAGDRDVVGMLLGKWKNHQKALVKLMLGSPELLEMFGEAVYIARMAKKDGFEKSVNLTVKRLDKAKRD